MVATDSRLYVGGAFYSIGGATAQNVAVWNGAAWGGLGSGVTPNHGNYPGRPLSFAAWGGRVVAGGEFTTADGQISSAIAQWGAALPQCYPNCDCSASPPVLSVSDFACFLERFRTSDPYANCDGSAIPPTVNIADFTCFLQKYAAGCR